MKKELLLLLIIISLGFSEVSICSQEVSDGYLINIFVTDYNINTKTVNTRTRDGHIVNQDFSTVVFRGALLDGDIGDPQNHITTFDIALGSESVTLEVLSFELDTLYLYSKLYPIQTPITMSGEAESDATFDWNKSAYQAKSRSVEDIAKITAQYTFREQNATTIGVKLSSYNPLQNELYIIKSVKLKVVTDPVRVLQSSNSKQFESIMRNKFININENTSVSRSRADTKEKYLIIMAGFSSSPALDEFVDYRSQEFDVKVVDVYTVMSSGWGKDVVRDYVRAEMPAYLLLVGGTANFPIHYASKLLVWEVPCLTYYVASSTTGHPNPDIAMGIFPTATEEELQNLVTKTIQSEMSLSSMNKTYYGHAGFVDGLENLAAVTGELVLKEINQKYFQPNGYTFELESAIDGVAGDDLVDLAAINVGVQFMNYAGHGLRTKWQYGITTDAIPNFTNTRYPIIHSNACLTGAFAYTPRPMAEEFVVAPNGPVAFIAASQNSTKCGYMLNKGLYHAIFTENITRYGNAWLYGVNSNVLPDAVSHANIVANERAYMAWEYHLFGDPALETIGDDSVVIADSFNLKTAKKTDIKNVTVLGNSLHFSSKLIGTASFALYDLRGKQVISITSVSASINLSDLNIGIGIYIARVVSKNGVVIFNNLIKNQ